MMQITILTIGSRGDAQPYVGLGAGLKAAGHRVRVATHNTFRELVCQRGLDFAPVEGNPRAIVEAEAGQAWLASGRNPIAFVSRLAKLARPILDRSLVDSWRACQGADAIIFSALGFAGYSAAEKLGVPCFSALVQPASRTRDFPNPILAPTLQLGGPLNRLTYLVAEQLLWQPFRSSLNRFRVETLGLDPFPLAGPFARLSAHPIPALYGFSPSVIPRPADWHESIYITGYWFLDAGPDWRPSPTLVEFLRAGPPPVYVGFGSMRPRNPPLLVEMVVEALRRAGKRGILLAGWGDLSTDDLPETVIQIDSVPHDWLFPRVAAVVHHGGAGTTAAGLRAGVPSVITPFFADQPFWGKRVADLGAGPAPISQSKLTADRLAEAIRIATTDPSIRSRAEELGRRIRGEDGIRAAIEAFEREVGLR